MSRQVMLSYSRKNEEFVRHFHDDLLAHNIKTWVDWKDIVPGYSWRQALYDGVMESDVIILLLSPDYIASEMCRMECFLARIYNKQIIPVMIENCWDTISDHFETKGLEDFSTMILSEESEPASYDTNHLESIVKLVNEGFSLVPEEAVYLSYSRRHKEYADKLTADLRAANIPVWMDAMMDIGVDWREALWNVLKRARAIIVILDTNTPTSHIIKREVLVARTRHLPTFPVVTPEIIEGSDVEREMRRMLDESYEMRLLSEIQWLRPVPDYDKMLDKLVTALRPLWEIE